jgi:hypothetical protein
MERDSSEEVDRPADAPAEVPRLVVEINGWFEPEVDRLRRDYFALVRGRGVPKAVSVALNAPKYLELRRFVESQAAAQTDPKIVAEQRRSLVSAESVAQSTESWCSVLLVKMSECYGVSNALRACRFFLMLQLAWLVRDLAAYQTAGDGLLAEESLEWFDSRRPLPTLSQFIYGHTHLLEVVVGGDPYAKKKINAEKVYLPLERVENDGTGGIITKMWESAVNLPLDLWVEYVVPQLTALRAHGFNSYHAWTPAEAHYVTEGVVWEGGHSYEFTSQRIEGTRHSVLKKETHVRLEDSLRARRYLELITEPPVQHSGPFHFFRREADLTTIAALGEDVTGSVVAEEGRTWRAPSVWHAAVWLMHTAAGVAEGKEIHPKIEGRPPHVRFQDALLFHGTADAEAELRPNSFPSDDRNLAGKALLRFMLAMEAINMTERLPAVTADGYVGVGNHYGLQTYLITMNPNPLAAVLDAVREAERDTEAVVYWMPFGKVTSLGGKVNVPPPWAERVHGRKELFVDFKEVEMSDVKGECSRLLFPADVSFLDFELVNADEEHAADEAWFEAARRWAVESRIEVEGASRSDARHYADELYARIGSPPFIDPAFIAEREWLWRARFADLLKWLMLKRGEEFYLSCAPVRLLLPHTLGLLAWFAQIERSKDENDARQDDAGEVREYMNAVKLCLEQSGVGGE